MSQIDQAFIQAYAPDAGDAAAAELQGFLPAEQQVKGTQPSGAPHIQLYSGEQTVAPAPQAKSKSEPIPAPHFRGPVGGSAHSDTATMQRAMFESSGVQAEAPASERRPLSAFAEPKPAPSNAFEPVFEVDAFRWPTITDDLLTNHGELLTPVVEQLMAASESGQSVVGIAGATPGVGNSTILMCLARLLAVVGKSVAIVDSNFVSANLAKNLGLEFDTGWDDVLAGKVPLAECAVRSIDDNMVLLPLNGGAESPAELLSSIQTSVIAGVMRYHYDLVLFDLGAAGRDLQNAVGRQIVEQCRLDTSIIVASSYADANESDQEIDALMHVLGSTCLGVIGNFAAK